VRGEVPERGVPAAAVVEGLDVVEDFQVRRWMSSFLRVAKKLSATALS
jgi:hypothetical protein